MKIIRRGEPEPKKVWIGRCRHCDSVAEATFDELTHYTPSLYRGDGFSWEVCPVCGHGDPSTGYGGMCFQKEQVK